jgi:hypothetical protein
VTAQIDPAEHRDVLTPREVAQRAGFSYHAILRAIRRGDLVASEPVPGQYRILLDDYERWLSTPIRRNERTERPPRRPHKRSATSDRGSFARLEAIERGG